MPTTADTSDVPVPDSGQDVERTSRPMIKRVRITSLFGDVASLGRSCPLSGARLALVAALLAAAPVLTSLTGLLFMAALLVAADAVVPHPTRPEGDAAERF